VCIAYSVTIYVSGFGKCGSLVIVCILYGFFLKIVCIALSVINCARTTKNGIQL
jgi:hypothetical protein